MINCAPFFDQNVVPQSSLQEHLVIILHSKLNFSKYLKTVFQKTNKIIWILLKLQNLLPKAPLIAIYKLLMTLHLDYGDRMYD